MKRKNKGVLWLMTAFLVLGLSATPLLGETAMEDHFVAQKGPRYMSFTGNVISVETHHSIENGYFVTMESEAGEPAHFVLTDKTFWIGSKEIQEGDLLTGYYDASRPMILIYPPQYSIDVLVTQAPEGFFKVDFFNKLLESQDNKLKLNLNEETEILDAKGEVYQGELGCQPLVVYYTSSTKSIPALTTPEKVVVMEQYWDEVDYKMIPHMKMQVGDELLDIPSAWVGDRCDIMVPLRGIAEALDKTVLWQGVNQPVLVDGRIALYLGEDRYEVGEKVYRLGQEAILKEGVTYVPLSMFEELIGDLYVVIRDQVITFNSLSTMK